MTTRSLDRLLTRLEQCRYRFGTGEETRVVRLLSQLSRQYFADVSSLIRFHEALLFLRAFPHGSRVDRKSEKLLRSFVQRVERLQQAGADMAQFDPLEVSGIAGSCMEDALSFNVVRWLVRRLPGKVEVVWKGYGNCSLRTGTSQVKIRTCLGLRSKVAAQITDRTCQLRGSLFRRACVFYT